MISNLEEGSERLEGELRKRLFQGQMSESRDRRPSSDKPYHPRARQWCLAGRKPSALTAPASWCPLRAAWPPDAHFSSPPKDPNQDGRCYMKGWPLSCVLAHFVSLLSSKKVGEKTSRGLIHSSAAQAAGRSWSKALTRGLGRAHAQQGRGTSTPTVLTLFGHSPHYHAPSTMREWSKLIRGWSLDLTLIWVNNNHQLDPLISAPSGTIQTELAAVPYSELVLNFHGHAGSFSSNTCLPGEALGDLQRGVMEGSESRPFCRISQNLLCAPEVLTGTY